MSLLSSVQNNNIRQLELLLAGPHNQDDLHKALIYACRHGYTQAVACFLKGGIDPDTTDASGCPLLYVAIRDGHCDVARALCNAGASVNMRSVNMRGDGGTAPLHLAAKAGQEECLELLLKFCCNINIKDYNGNTALILAVKNKKYSAISVLLATGRCDANIQDSNGRTALHFASHTAVAVDSLLKHGADVNIRDSDGCTPLLMAATEGLDNIVDTLCHVTDCDVNIPNCSRQKTPLHILAGKGHTRSVRSLLLCGADVNLVDVDNRSPLWYAVSNGKRDVTSFLLTWPGLHTSCGVSTTVQCCCPVEQAFVRNRKDILKVMILTGYDTQHLRQVIRSGTQALLIEDDMNEWVELAFGVPSLRHFARRTVRHSLGETFEEKLPSLPLPDKVRKYLAFHGLGDFNFIDWLA